MVRTQRDGKVSIVAKDKEQSEKIRDEIDRTEGMDVRCARSMNPMIMVTGVNAEMEDTELMECMRRKM